ncbi:hypothetical protein ACFWRG_31250 [Micromonospora tulbaghiae]|uniref:Uncharacterized protein n=1 Tax=Streptomyces nanshensis TaxID=518642 RepID=A0A1E7LTA7_9ACTN|nr:hypothetical protein AN221_16640 [Streptomyces nanshensis]
MPVIGGKGPNPWGRWALRWGVPSAVVALGSVWVVEPATRVGAITAAGVALTALLVFVGTMPRRQTPARPRSRRGAGE